MGDLACDLALLSPSFILREPPAADTQPDQPHQPQRRHPDGRLASARSLQRASRPEGPFVFDM